MSYTPTRRPKLPADYEEQCHLSMATNGFSQEERREFEKAEAKVLKYDAWRYSLTNEKNVFY